MYTLTLEKGERDAIDWIGGRYAHGRELYGALCDAEWLPSEADWDFDGPITFRIPESTAWLIRDCGAESEFRWDCFDEALAAKLNEFCDKIV